MYLVAKQLRYRAYLVDYKARPDPVFRPGRGEKILIELARWQLSTTNPRAVSTLETK